MSIKLMDKVWELQSLSQPRKMLLLSIADFASDEGLAWPAVATLMRKCSLRSESGTRRAINELVSLGWISKQERPKKDRKGKHQQDTNLYQINLVKLYEEAAIHERVPRTPSISVKNEPAHGDGSRRDGSQHDGLCDAEKSGFEPVPRTPDPSLRSDPSLNPTHSARGGEVELVNQNPIPDYPGQPGVCFPASQMIGKFPMKPDWTPSPDFQRQAVLWGKPVPDGLNLRAELASFIAFWTSEGKVFTQTQWELKFARHLQGAKPTQPRGNTHAGLDKYPPTYNAAQRRMLDARREQLRKRGQSMEVLDLDDGNLLEPLDGQKRPGPVGPMDCADWEFDQRPDDERL